MSQREKSLYSGFFWFVFSRMWIEYGEIFCILYHVFYPVQMQENMDQKNSEYGHFLRSVCNVIEIKNNEILLSFLVERSWNQWLLSKKSSAQEDPGKRRCFRRFDQTH